MTERLAVACALGVVCVVLEGDGSLDLDVEVELPARASVETGLPLVVDADASGSRVVAVVARRPPLVVSDDRGTTWREAGGGLPAGRAVSLSPDHPDRIAYATPSRLYVSADGGVFWHALTLELPEITAVRWLA